METQVAAKTGQMGFFFYNAGRKKRESRRSRGE
jgi:hypothetical protein